MPKPDGALVVKWRQLAEEGYLYAEIARMHPQFTVDQVRHYCLGHTGRNIAGPILTMFAGALTLGSFSIAMVWGHWYLVNPKLEAGPLNELTLISFGAVLLQLGITALNAIIPAGMDLDSNALLAIDLAANPAFWLRIGIGLVFPAALAYMAYSSSRENSMMSATGLLYIAVGAILAGEALGRGLLFVTGSAV